MKLNDIKPEVLKEAKSKKDVRLKRAKEIYGEHKVLFDRLKRDE